MKDFYDSLSARDGALFFWLCLLFAFMLAKSSIRQSLVDLAKSFLKKDILLLLVLYVIYMTVCMALMHQYGLWHPKVAKDSLFWMLGSGLPTLLTVTKLNTGRDFITLLAKSSTLSVILSAYTGLATFSFFTEVVLAFVLTLLTLLVLVSMQQKHELIHSLLLIIQLFAGLAFVCMTGHWLWNNWMQVNWLNQLMALLVPFNLLLLSIPFFYLTALFGLYQNVFIRLPIWVADEPGLHQKAFWMVLLDARLDMNRLSLLSRNLHRIDFKSGHILFKTTGGE